MQLEKKLENLTIIKLGGAAITDKSKEFTLRKGVINRVISEMTQSPSPVIIVHGAGSFAHNLAKKYNLKHGWTEDKSQDEQRLGVAKIRLSMQQLNNHILQISINHGLYPFSTPVSSSLISAGSGVIHDSFFKPVSHALINGFTPITYGDISFDTVNGFRVISGDRIIKLLVEFIVNNINIKPKVIFGSDVDGLYDKNPNYKDAKLIQRVTSQTIDKVLTGAGESAGTDVTGGMWGKLMEIKEILDFGVNVTLLNLRVTDRLLDYLNGNTIPCTEIIAEN